MGNKSGRLGIAFALCILVTPCYAQNYFPDNPYYQYPQQQDDYQNYTGNLQYDNRDAERILRDQVERGRADASQAARQANARPQRQQTYDNYYGHRIHDEDQVQRVVGEANYIAGMIKNRNGKAFLVVDTRNFQFYLYDRNGKLLRIGPVAIGKGKTNVGAFETPVGIFPIKAKIPVDDWIRPDWYFIEEGEPIPKRWEDRRVPGFFRYKLVFDGTRYIHYAEATGGRMTHGCLGLDWQDAEAVFHTMEVGSNCIIADQNLFSRLARGEFPVPKAAVKQVKPESGGPMTASIGGPEQEQQPTAAKSEDNRSKVIRNLW